MNFPPSRCEIRVRERLTFFTVHLGIIHKKTALVNKNKRIGARKFDFSANFGFPDQKADHLFPLLSVSRQQKNGKIKANSALLGAFLPKNSKCSKKLLHEKAKKAEILIITEDSSFLIFTEILSSVFSSENSRRNSP